MPTKRKASPGRREKVERFELIESVDEARFRVSGRKAVLQLLKRIREKSIYLTVFSPMSKKSFLTVFFEVDAQNNRILFDSPGDSILRKRFLSGGTVTVATAIDRVRVQFTLTDIAEVVHNDNPAFSAAFPTQITRLQRRDFYRLTVPVITPVQCEVGFGNSLWAIKSRYAVYDISLGGIGINNLPLMPVGHKIERARVFLPEEDAFSADLIVCHTFSIYLKNGQRVLRTGCRYAEASPTRDQRIQRYINRITMEQCARENRTDTSVSPRSYEGRAAKG